MYMSNRSGERLVGMVFGIGSVYASGGYLIWLWIL